MRIPWILCFIFLILLSIEPSLQASPRLYNEMPPYLQPFKDKVEEQARLFPDTFFLQALDGQKRIALTFDDGPGPLTPLILDVLKEHDVRATFFILGHSAKSYPEVVERILKEGHVLGNHSWSHRDLRELTPLEILQEELHPTSTFIEDLTGLYPLLMRPPYGAVEDEAVLFLGEEGWKIINWSLDTFDWDREQNSKEEILERVRRYLHPGAILLMHDSGGDRTSTLKALPLLIEVLEEEGYTLTTLDRLLNLSPYYH